MRRAFPRQAQVLTDGVKALGKDAQVTLCPMTNRKQAKAAHRGHGGQFLTLGVVQVDDGCAIGRQDAGKERGFGGEIGVEGLVIIQVVLGEIRETGSAQAHAVHAALVKTVGGRLHRGMGDAGGGGLGQDGMQGDGVGGGVGRGPLPRAFDAGGADVDGGVAKQGPDLAAEGRDRGLAVGAGDGDHGFGLGAEPEGRGRGQRLARVFCHNQRHVRGGKGIGGKPGACSIGQNGGGTGLQGGGDIAGTMDGSSGHRGKEKARADRPAVKGQAGQNRIATGPGGQAKSGQVLGPGTWVGHR